MRARTEAPVFHRVRNLAASVSLGWVDGIYGRTDRALGLVRRPATVRERARESEREGDGKDGDGCVRGSLFETAGGA